MGVKEIIVMNLAEPHSFTARIPRNRVQCANFDRRLVMTPVWLDKVPAAQAIWEVGFFANQNSVGRPRAEEWRYTVEKLKGRFSNWDVESIRLRDKYSPAAELVPQLP